MWVSLVMGNKKWTILGTTNQLANISAENLIQKTYLFPTSSLVDRKLCSCIGNSSSLFTSEYVRHRSVLKQVQLHNLRSQNQAQYTIFSVSNGLESFSYLHRILTFMYTSALWVDRQFSNTKFNSISHLCYAYDRIRPVPGAKQNQTNIPKSLRLKFSLDVFFCLMCILSTKSCFSRKRSVVSQKVKLLNFYVNKSF